MFAKLKSMRLLLLLSLALTSFGATATLNGKKVHYTATGGGTQTLIFIHGWSCDETFFAPQVKDFQPTYRVITIDLPGHGQSDSIAPLTMDLFAQSIEAVRAAEKINSPILVGHSLGAAVARQHARLYPNRAKALVFFDGSIFQLPPDEAGKQRWSEMISTMSKTFGPSNEKAVRERAISAFLSNMYADDTTREFRLMVLGKVLSTKPETSEAAMYAMADLNLWRDDTIDLPVLALRAGKRPPPGEEIYLKQLFPRIQYKFLPGMSHFLMLEKPAEVNAELRIFLKGLKP